jgi:hypothetical protein
MRDTTYWSTIDSPIGPLFQTGLRMLPALLRLVVSSASTSPVTELTSTYR